LWGCVASNRARENQNEGKIIADKFHALAKGLAQSVTRRGALKKFGLGLAGTALASLVVASEARRANVWTAFSPSKEINQ